jgi:hypothetical protein
MQELSGYKEDLIDSIEKGRTPIFEHEPMVFSPIEGLDD